MADFTFAHREEGFDEHIEKSIRGYSQLMSDVVSLSRHFVEDDTNIVDIGCSTGKMTQRLLEENQDHCVEANYVGVEIAEGFFKDLDKRHEDIVKNNPWAKVDFIKDDIRNYKFKNCSLITSIFTLQFMSPKDRQEVLNKVYNGLNKGGAFIFSEKTFSCNPRVQDMMTFMYYDYKRKNFSDKDILDKEVQLRHMMKPNTKTELYKMVQDAGFEIHTFWQNFNFVGVIGLKK